MLERHHQCLRLLATVLAVAAALLAWGVDGSRL